MGADFIDHQLELALLRDIEARDKRIAGLEAKLREAEVWRDGAVLSCARRRCSELPRELREAEREIAELRADLEWAAERRLGAFLSVDDTPYVEWVPYGNDGSEVCDEEYDGTPFGLRAAIRQARKGGE